MEKRLILAIALSVLIILAFQYIAPKPTILPAPPTVKTAPTTAISTDKATVAASGAAGIPTAEACFDIETDRYILTFSNLGGAIKSIRLKDYKSTESNEPLEIFRIKNPKDYILTIDNALGIPGLDTSIYNLDKKDGLAAYSITVNGFEITKRYALHKSKYIIELQLFIKNLTSSAKEFNYRIIGGSALTEENPQDKRFVEVTSNINGKVVNFKRPKRGERIINPGIVGWTALKNRYFSIILKPFAATKGQFYGEDIAGYFVTGIDMERITVQPNSTVENKFILYAGPGHIPLLKEIGYGFEETVNYGFFGGISKMLLSLMRFFYRIVGNWGVAVIILSIFLNIILFPLTLKSFKSMEKMQEIHPQMEKLRVQYKDNPQKLNKEIMELYKKYKINPFGGCLPLLLQMPIFVALYNAMLRSIELKNSSFLWIRDLSMPDAVKLPASFPIIGNSVNILPLIMVVAMVLQQRISTKSMGSAVTEDQKQQQKIMLVIMPIVFGFIFYNMPSGLVLYWVINTTLTIIEQASFLRKT